MDTPSFRGPPTLTLELMTMADLPKRFCTHPGCSEWAVDRGRCEAHAKEKHAELDKRRGSAKERGYDRTWSAESKRFRKANPLCLGCRAVGRVVATTQTDHTIPHKGDPKLFWDKTNWQPACDWHHDKLKQILERMYESGEIPASELRLDSMTAVKLTRQLLNL